MYFAIHAIFLGSSDYWGLLAQSQWKLVKCRYCCMFSHSTADSSSYLPVTEHHFSVAAEMVILIIQRSLYSLPLTILLLLSFLSQLFTECENCLLYQAPNLSIFNFWFLCFLSCLSAVPGELVLPSWTEGIFCRLPLLTTGEFLRWSLQITCLCTALLFCHYHSNKQ